MGFNYSLRDCTPLIALVTGAAGTIAGYTGPALIDLSVNKGIVCEKAKAKRFTDG